MINRCRHIAGKVLEKNDTVRCFRCGESLGKVSEGELYNRGLVTQRLA